MPNSLQPPRAAAHQFPLPFTISQRLLKFTSFVLVLLSKHHILCHCLLLLPLLFLSIRVFSSVLALHIRWTKYWSFSFSINPSSEYSGLVSFRINWFDLLSVQEALKSLLQHHSSKASILWSIALFTVQLSHLKLFPWVPCKDWEPLLLILIISEVYFVWWCKITSKPHTYY